jgi:hypothetical protein
MLRLLFETQYSRALSRAAIILTAYIYALMSIPVCWFNLVSPLVRGVYAPRIHFLRRELLHGPRRANPGVIREVAQQRFPTRRDGARMLFRNAHEPFGFRVRQGTQQHALAQTTEKTAVVAPMPSASVSRAVAVKLVLRRIIGQCVPDVP